MLLLVKTHHKEKSAYRRRKNPLTVKRKICLPRREKTAYRVVVNLPYHPQPFTVGRKNWLFSDSQRGAQASAICYTIIEMAKAHELNAFKYLNYLLVNREEKDFTLLAPWSPLVKETCRVN